MVSFWPWRNADTSPASFEKTLSALSAKITTTQAKLDKTRASARRTKVLWVLYLGFAYLVYAIVQLVVVGHQNMGPAEYAGMAGGPVFIILTRKLIGAYFNYSIDSLTKRLNDQQEERSKTIQKLKDATKYDSTMELIEKYGGEKKKEAAAETDANKSKAQGSQPGAPNRTRMPPPPTANIQHRPPPGPQGPESSTPPPQPASLEPGAEFAPNAFSHPQPASPGAGTYAAAAAAGPPDTHWYDRIFDVLLGEDETASKNRIVLLCASCRLVNGQAPPGTRSLAEVGTWRCMGCHALNGEPDEGRRIVEEVLGGPNPADEEKEEEKASGEDGGEADGVDVSRAVDAEVSATGTESKQGAKQRRSGQKK